MDNDIDISFFKKMLLQVKGAQQIKVNQEDELLQKVIKKSREQFEKGEYQELSEGLLDKIFDTK
ncbi:MAG: hypothetical protein CSA38_00155 [Flavobacteriales bacterium]|nr:MAG: hypothetical protein CSA38_00155 [Flavobacteriales bacterium]